MKRVCKWLKFREKGPRASASQESDRKRRTTGREAVADQYEAQAGGRVRHWRLDPWPRRQETWKVPIE